MFEFLFLLILVASFGIYIGYTVFKKHNRVPSTEFPNHWRLILIEHVLFYKALDEDDKDRFEKDVHYFLANTRITGIETEVEELDKVLVASSAVIPIFGFPQWRYSNIFEVLLYSEHFNYQFETEGKGRSILGMVGTGYMEGKMALSQKALRHGFENASDKRNTAIHEFVHLVDKMDGAIDGIPELLLDKQYIVPWLELIDIKMYAMQQGDSDINPYGAGHRVEFLTVVSEYFFERPKLLKKKHPTLYEMLEDMFNQSMHNRNMKRRKQSISRNSKCPCESGQKFKKCCGSEHYRRK